MNKIKYLFWKSLTIMFWKIEKFWDRLLICAATKENYYKTKKEV